MPNLLMFEWPKDRDGYEILEFDPRGVVWQPDANGNVSPPEGSSPSIVQLLKRWGMGVGPEPGHKNKSYLILEPVGDEAVTTQPLETNPGLFVDFAETALNPEGVKAFADKNGQIHSPVGPDMFWSWYREIKRMRNAVRAWEKGKKEGSLRQWVSNFNRRYTEFLEKKGRSNASIRLQNTDDPLRPYLHVVPNDLLSAMWLQFAQQVSSATGLRRCKWCSTWFVYGTGTGRRKSGHYCSPRCYKAAWKSENPDKLKR